MRKKWFRSRARRSPCTRRPPVASPRGSKKRGEKKKRPKGRNTCLSRLLCVKQCCGAFPKTPTNVVAGYESVAVEDGPWIATSRGPPSFSVGEKFFFKLKRDTFPLFQGDRVSVEILSASLARRLDARSARDRLARIANLCVTWTSFCQVSGTLQLRRLRLGRRGGLHHPRGQRLVHPREKKKPRRFSKEPTRTRGVLATRSGVVSRISDRAFEREFSRVETTSRD